MRIRKFLEIDSTNTYLKNSSDIMDYDLVIAERQNAGRGRRGNEWKSLEGAGLFSFVLEEEKNLELEEFVKLPLVMGLAVVKAVKNIPEIIYEKNLDFKFKWTNDIYLNGKKLSGILLEKKDNFMIIGIGININNEDFGTLGEKATSLKKESCKNFQIEDIIFQVVVQLKTEYKRFLKGEWNEILKEINNMNYLYGKEVTVEGMNRILTGTAGEILSSGMLRFTDSEGREMDLSVGEVHLKNIR